MTTHLMFDGKLQVYRRRDGTVWQCAARVEGQRFHESTKEEALDRAKDVAEEWYLDLRGKLRAGQIKKKERTFADAAALYLKDLQVLTLGVRSPKYVEFTRLRMNRHVLPYFGSKPFSEINKGLVQAYRVKRIEETLERTGKPPARSTMLQEIVCIRQVLKHAEGLGWIPFVPNLSTPYMTQGKKGRRAWFTPEEYKRLYTATRKGIEKEELARWKPYREELHDFVLFMGNSGLRPDEAATLQIQDVNVEADYGTRETILVIDVRGKTGVGFCKTMNGAVKPFERLVERRRGELVAQGLTEEQVAAQLPATPLFRKFDRDRFNLVLREQGLKTDRDGKSRTAYSLRHTYISMRLMEGANIHQIANNCRTSVQMIEEHYASHIKDRLDASAINVQRPKAARKAAKALAGRKKSVPPGGEAPSL